jgi:flavin-dependent dehydrogenase
MAKALRELYDLVVIGGGPAGLAAVCRASKKHATVLIIDQEGPSRAGLSTGWLGPAGVALCQECGLSAKSAGAVVLRGVRLHSWDLRRDAFVDDPELRAWVVDRTPFEAALLKQASKAGTRSLHGVAVQDLNLAEDRVVLSLSDGREVSGRVMLIADGVNSPTARMANLPAAGQMRAVPRCLFVQYEAQEKETRLDVAVGARRTGQLATIMRCGKTVSLAITMRGAEGPLEEQFRAFCREALKCGLLPEGVPDQAQQQPSPAGIALDMDTHVGKRCLLIGDAGGFVAAFSNEAIYPAMWSGWIAADTALHALQTPVVQDQLATFGVAWRQELADYLRMPNTDLSLLAPLIFNNEQMSRRVARAFLLGQAF